MGRPKTVDPLRPLCWQDQAPATPLGRWDAPPGTWFIAGVLGAILTGRPGVELVVPRCPRCHGRHLAVWHLSWPVSTAVASFQRLRCGVEWLVLDDRPHAMLASRQAVARAAVAYARWSDSHRARELPADDGPPSLSLIDPRPELTPHL
jgi:hypothetical protein